MAWLIAALHPRGPHPILALSGPQGSAKSTAARLLKSIIDPTQGPLRPLPTKEDDLILALRNQRVLSFDNVSEVKPEMSDALCRVATGGGLVKRKLYTDSDEIFFIGTTPVIVNGIDDLGSRPDLLERSIRVEHTPIACRKTEAEINQAFNADLPQILGALLDSYVHALKYFQSVNLKRPFRMADFAKLATAAEPSFGTMPVTFEDAYAANMERVSEIATEDSVSILIRKLAAMKPKWSGTASELLAELESLDPKARERRDWPDTGRTLSNALKRVAPNLNAQGLEITYRRSNGDRLIEVKRLTVPTVPQVPL